MRPLPAFALTTLFAVTLFAQSYKTADGYSLPEPGRHFVFPRDHGSHPEFKLEWWYLTGHLFSQNGSRFGLQATFFRKADGTASRGNLFLAHMAVLDVKTGRFIYQERINREGWDASASKDSLDVKCGPWSLRMDDSGRIHLTGSVRADAAFELGLHPVKPLVLFGEQGVSHKGADPSAASHYLTFPRIEANGNLTLGLQTITVKGQLWMDHEISSSQLDETQIGWDWACLQLNDGREIMVYRMRRKDGTIDPYSTLAWVEPSGLTHQVGADAFALNPITTWHSPHTGAEYPSGVVLTTVDPATSKALRWKLVPLAKDQELAGHVTGMAYWEGSCRVVNEQDQEIGSAFLELTGYSGDLGKSLR